jgi:hypothetical protein
MWNDLLHTFSKELIKVGLTLLSRPNVLEAFCSLVLILGRCGLTVYDRYYFWMSADRPAFMVGLSTPAPNRLMYEGYVTMIGYLIMLAPPPPRASILPFGWGHKLSMMIRKDSLAIPDTESKDVY